MWESGGERTGEINEEKIVGINNGESVGEINDGANQEKVRGNANVRRVTIIDFERERENGEEIKLEEYRLGRV